MRRATLIALALVLAGCGGSKKNEPTHHQPNLTARATGKTAERVGAQSCKTLPPGTIPQEASRAAKVAALRAYLQNSHPNDSVPAMLRGCLRVRHVR
jgi:hypothetical protein